jgi:hypothetical protein
MEASSLRVELHALGLLRLSKLPKVFLSKAVGKGMAAREGPRSCHLLYSFAWIPLLQRS